MSWSSQLLSKLTRRRPLGLTFLFFLQSLCAGYYGVEVIVEYRWSGLNAHTATEGFVTLVLLFSLGYTFARMLAALKRFRRVESSLHLASGAFREIVDTRFVEWKLSEAEAAVAMLTLKGFSINEAAKLRNSAAGTIRVQLSQVYAKSRTKSRSQFVSSFIEELIDDPMTGLDLKVN